MNENEVTGTISSTSLNSDGPGDDVMVAPEAEGSVVSCESSDETASYTSSEEDHALSYDPREKAINQDTIDMVEAVSGEFDKVHVTRDDDTLYNTRAIHNVRTINGKTQIWGWKRPCFRNVSTMVIGDSMIRCFKRAGKQISGYAIIAYGGLDLLELIVLIKHGQLNRDIDLKDPAIRKKIMDESLRIPSNRNCDLCSGDCVGSGVISVLINPNSDF